MNLYSILLYIEREIYYFGCLLSLLFNCLYRINLCHYCGEFIPVIPLLYDIIKIFIDGRFLILSQVCSVINHVMVQRFYLEDIIMVHGIPSPSIEALLCGRETILNARMTNSQLIDPNRELQTVPSRHAHSTNKMPPLLMISFLGRFFINNSRHSSPGNVSGQSNS